MNIKREIINILFTIFLLSTFGACKASDVGEEINDEDIIDKYQRMRVGYSIALSRVTAEKMEYIKSVGIESIEVGGMGYLIDGRYNFTKSDQEIQKLMLSAKKAADDAGIEIWSIHMPFGAEIDLSMIDENERKRVVEGHTRLLSFLEILEPEIILFHPSYYLDPANQRELRKFKFVNSATELDHAVRSIGSIMVIENMLGFDLMAGERERPLMRTVEETVELFNRLPKTIHSAVDMNHIKYPERLIRAMGSRLKSIHIADGTGKAENHWLPCTGQGENDWMDIMSALYEVGYTGPFMFECQFNDEKDLTDCYKSLYNSFIKSQLSY